MTDLSSGSEQILSISRGREDSDPEETAEWLEALDAVTEHVGRDRAQYLYDRLAEHALSLGIESSRARVTPYINTIPVAEQPRYPGCLFNHAIANGNGNRGNAGLRLAGHSKRPTRRNTADARHAGSLHAVASARPAA